MQTETAISASQITFSRQTMEITAASVTTAARPANAASDRISISDHARHNHNHGHHLRQIQRRESEDSQSDPMDKFLRDLIGMLSGQKVTGLKKTQDDDGEITLPQPQAGTQSLQYQQTSYSAQHLNLSVSGTINTSDGKQLAFSMELNYDHAEFSSQSASLQSGQNGTSFNYSGTAAELTSTSFSFTLAGTDSGSSGGTGRFQLMHEMKDIFKALKPLVGDLSAYLNNNGQADQQQKQVAVG
jgi:hypothetical protein